MKYNRCMQPSILILLLVNSFRKERHFWWVPPLPPPTALSCAVEDACAIGSSGEEQWDCSLLPRYTHPDRCTTDCQALEWWLNWTSLVTQCQPYIPGFQAPTAAPLIYFIPRPHIVLITETAINTKTINSYLLFSLYKLIVLFLP